MNSSHPVNRLTSDTNRPAASRSTSPPIRAGIVGTGYIADFHARAIQQAEGVELVSICDTNPKSAEVFAARWGISKVFNSLEAMLQSRSPEFSPHPRSARSALPAS